MSLGKILLSVSSTLSVTSLVFGAHGPVKEHVIKGHPLFLHLLKLYRHCASLAAHTQRGCVRLSCNTFLLLNDAVGRGRSDVGVPSELKSNIMKH